MRYYFPDFTGRQITLFLIETSVLTAALIGILVVTIPMI
ncbi:hypothetical protein FHX06_007261 [Rhizobium sp. BK512]|jgi:hypothetical protein|nr:hypothetical protein [Rhizobium sp. BK379]MBB3565887.1 hypothetical protein [Rhizobium sp. BK512]